MSSVITCPGHAISKKWDLWSSDLFCSVFLTYLSVSASVCRCIICLSHVETSPSFPHPQHHQFTSQQQYLSLGSQLLQQQSCMHDVSHSSRSCGRHVHVDTYTYRTYVWIYLSHITQQRPPRSACMCTCICVQAGQKLVQQRFACVRSWCRLCHMTDASQKLVAHACCMRI